MSEMEKFEKELNELELDTIEDEEFKRKLYLTLMEKYESKRRFILTPFFKISIVVSLLILLAIPLYFVFYPRLNKNITKREEVNVMEKVGTSSLLDNLTRDDKLINVEEQGDREILIYESGLRIVKVEEKIIKISYGEKAPLLRYDIHGEGVTSSMLNKIEEIIEKDPKVGFLVKGGRIVESGKVKDNLYYIILVASDREWRIVVDTEEKKVVSFSSPPY